MSAEQRRSTGPRDSPGCDDYPYYLDQTWGYSYRARDVVSVAALERHDELVEADPGTLGDVDVGELDDFLTWAVARAARANGALDEFVDRVDGILTSDDDHPALNYREVHLTAARTCLRDGRFDRARDLLDSFEHRWPDRAMPARRESCLLALEADGPEAARERVEAFLEVFTDPEAALELAEDLNEVGSDELAGDALRKARRRAEERGDGALLVDIELLERRLGETSTGD
ncbi:MAG: hypothetical protein ABEL76_03975 [Bradymonadaceae bacterium]